MRALLPRGRAALAVVGLVLGLSVVVGVQGAAAVSSKQAESFPAPSWTDTVGPVALSSPTIATIDGVQAVVFGAEDGELYVVSALTGDPLPGWPEPVDLSGSGPSAIESSPTVAYLDGPKRPPTIIVGAGSTYAGDQQGGLVAFNANGTLRFTFHTLDIFNEWSGSASDPRSDGYDEGVFSTPAVGDLTGNGQQDIVFGSYDHRLYALSPHGTLLKGFPIDTQDTIWSSPALDHVRGKRLAEDIFVGGDASGLYGCHGGFVYDVTDDNGSPRIVWKHCEDQTIWSSPAVGVLNATGRLAVVVGTGFGEPPPYLPGSDKIYAFYAGNGARVPGWPVSTTGPVFGSPAIGPIGTSQNLAVVDTSWCTTCSSSPGTSMVDAFAGNGAELWSTPIEGAQDFSSPVLADIAGNGENDVLVGSAAGLYPLDGETGAYLYGTTEDDAVNNCSMQNAPLVADVAGSGPASGWRVFETCGGPRELIATGRLIDYPLPGYPELEPPWPMWRQNPAHDGVTAAG